MVAAVAAVEAVVASNLAPVISEKRALLAADKEAPAREATWLVALDVPEEAAAAATVAPLCHTVAAAAEGCATLMPAKTTEPGRCPRRGAAGASSHGGGRGLAVVVLIWRAILPALSFLMATGMRYKRGVEPIAKRNATFNNV